MGLRYEQVYSASQFSTFAPGGEEITQIAFRVGAEAAGRLDHGAFVTTVPAIQFTLSTTLASPGNLSSSFANNLGADATTVYGIAGIGSPLTISSTGTLTADPAPFDIVVSSSTPFFYNPASGNLLLDIQNYEGAESPSGIELDGILGDGTITSRAYNYGDASASTTNNAGDYGVVTEFVATPIPEPTIDLMLTAGMCLLGIRQVRRS